MTQTADPSSLPALSATRVEEIQRIREQVHDIGAPIQHLAGDRDACPRCRISYALDDLLAEVRRLQGAIRQHEEDEASVCPEDVGFVEYIRALESQLASAREETAQAVREACYHDVMGVPDPSAAPEGWAANCEGSHDHPDDLYHAAFSHGVAEAAKRILRARPSGQPRDAQAAGVIFYDLPDVLDYEHVDPLLRDVCRTINASGWVWTGESCQGHPDAPADEYVWAGNVRPYLRLTCAGPDAGRLLDALTRAQVETTWPCLAGVQVWRYQTPPEWAQFGVYIEGSTTEDRDRGLAVFGRLAALVSRSHPGETADA